MSRLRFIDNFNDLFGLRHDGCGFMLEALGENKEGAIVSFSPF